MHLKLRGYSRRLLQSVEDALGDFRALDGIDLRIRQGDFFALLGPNGAGKTTLISIIADTSRHRAVYDQLRKIAPVLLLNSRYGTYTELLAQAQTIADAVGRSQPMKERINQLQAEMKAIAKIVPQGQSAMFGTSHQHRPQIPPAPWINPLGHENNTAIHALLLNQTSPETPGTSLLSLQTA